LQWAAPPDGTASIWLAESGEWLRRSSGSGIGSVGKTRIDLRVNLDVGTTWYTLDADPKHVLIAFENSFADFGLFRGYRVHSVAAGTTIDLIITGLSSGLGLIAAEFLKESGKDLWKAIKSLISHRVTERESFIPKKVIERSAGDAISLTLVIDKHKVAARISLPSSIALQDATTFQLLQQFAKTPPQTCISKSSIV